MDVPPIYSFQKCRTPFNFLKFVVRFMLSFIKLNARRQLTPGIPFFGYSLFVDARPGLPRVYGFYALDEALSLKPRTVLDVGSGAGHHAKKFSENGAEVTCVDYGTSIYAKSSSIKGLNIVNGDFNAFAPPHKFDLVWASHVLEHQRNVGIFLEKLIECCSENGHVCITVPDPHRVLAGGHLTLWSPGLLVYNIALCGVDISKSKFIRGTNEFSVLFRPVKVPLPPLTYDNGDITLLKPALPPPCVEGGDSWISW